MDTPLAAAVHKENVNVGGGKTATKRKPNKLKPTGKGRKALANLRDTYAPSAGVPNDVDLKPMAHGKQQIAGADLFTTKKNIVNRSSKVANLNTDSVSLGILSEEEVKQCHEWAKEGIEGMDRYSWSIEDEENLYKNQTLSEIMASAIGVSVSELEQPILSDNEGYDINDPDLHNPMSPSGNLSSFYTAKDLDDPLGVSGMVLDEYPLPELKLEDDFCLDNDNIIDEREACALLAELEKILLNKTNAKEALKKK